MTLYDKIVFNFSTKIHHTMLLNKHDNLLIVLNLLLLYLSTIHRINLDPSQEVKIDLTHCTPKTKQIYLYNIYLIITKIYMSIII